MKCSKYINSNYQYIQYIFIFFIKLDNQVLRLLIKILFQIDAAQNLTSG